MTKSPTFGSADVFIGDGGPAPQPAEPDAPFRLLVAGDFGGRAARGVLSTGAALAARKPVQVDADGLDEAMEKIGPELKLAGGPVLRFRELDDFHPDRLFDRVPRLAQLRDAAEDAASARSSRRPASAGLLDRILSGEPQEEAPAPPAETRPADDLDAAMRGILHADAFRSLELAWRGVDFLVRRLDVDGPLTLHLLDLSFDELATDLLSGPPEKGALHSILVEKTVGTPGGQPWGALVLLSTFERTREDAELLGRLLRVSARAGTPVLAGGGSSLLGCAALHETPDPDDWGRTGDADGEAAWSLLARQSEARFAGLALPRFLLRAPYGKETDPVEAFEFEEISPRAAHEEYAWAPSAFATALLLAEAFLEDGWGLRPGSAQDLESLPFVLRRVDGEKEPVPCAETLLTVRAAEAIADRGLMPLLSMKGGDRVRLGVFQSLAKTPLSGRWG